MKRLLDILFAWRELEVLRPLGGRGWALVMAVFILAALSLGAEQFSTPKLVGADAYYHTRISTLMAGEGLGQGFRWTQASAWRDRFADKEFLFHVLLMPFVCLDDVSAPKVLTVLLMALLASLLTVMAWRHAWPWPWLWPCMLAGAGVLFHLRVSLTRPHLLSILLVVMAAGALLRRHRPLLLGLAVLFPLAYTAAHMLLALCLVYGVARLATRQGFPWREFALVLGGTVIGLLLHPHRENLFYLWRLQNIQVVSNAFDRLGALAVEFLPPDGRLLLVDVGPLFLGVLGTGLAFSLLGKKASLATVFFFLASVAYLFLFLNIRRFVEYWVPFSILFMAAAAKDLLQGFDAKAWLKRHRVWGGVAIMVFIGVLSGSILRTSLGTQDILSKDSRPRYELEAAWLRDHLSKGEQVFTLWWTSFPFLFHHAPDQHYLVALDPTFMMAWDEERYQDWTRIATGQDPHAARRIPSRFFAHWVLAEKQPNHQGFIAQARRDKRFWLRFEGPDAIVFALPPDPVPLARAAARQMGAGQVAVLGGLAAIALELAWTGSLD